MAKIGGFNLLWALLGGVLGYVLGILLEATAIFPGVLELPAIGLLVGFLAGAFKDKFEELI